MVLGGLWHGANWTFVIWGFLHGLYLVLNHFYRYLVRIYNFPHLPRVLSQFITFFCVIIAWVFFRAENVQKAFAIIQSLFVNPFLNTEVMFKERIVWMVFFFFLISVFLPNTYEFIINRKKFGIFEFKQNYIWGTLISCLFIYTVYQSLDGVTEFLYFQF